MPRELEPAHCPMGVAALPTRLHARVSLTRPSAAFAWSSRSASIGIWLGEPLARAASWPASNVLDGIASSSYFDDVARDLAESRRLMDAAAGDDPAVGLTAVVALRQLLEILEELQVEHARQQGWVLAGHRPPAGSDQAGDPLQ